MELDNRLTVIRWTTAGLHTIVLVFGLAIGALTIDWNLLEAMDRARTDPVLEQAIRLCAMLVVGNLVGVILLLSRLFNSLIGMCVVLAFEISFFVASLVFLSADYSIVLGGIVLALVYAAILRLPSRTGATHS